MRTTSRSRSTATSDPARVAELYFAYGSNMSSARLLARVEGARALGAAALLDHRLVFDKPGHDGTAKANLRRVEDATAHGVLWEIEPHALATLDDFEPGYERVRRTVRMQHETHLEAWIYLHPGSDASLQPSCEYLDHLIAGAREHGLPRELLERLARFEATVRGHPAG